MTEILTAQQQEAENSVKREQLEKDIQKSLQSEMNTEQSPERAESKNELLYQKIITQVQTSPVANDEDDSMADLDAKAIIALEDMQVQVERLVQLAELKGVVYAVNVAKKLDFYVLDQVHDQLANHFYNTLVTKGLLEKE